MYNSNTPTNQDLPTTGKLIKSTILAAIVAGILLITVVMPSEYAIDPTGIGKMLGLTEMGEIKTSLAEEAAADAKAHAPEAKTTPEPTQQQQQQQNQGHHHGDGEYHRH